MHRPIAALACVAATLATAGADPPDPRPDRLDLVVVVEGHQLFMIGEDFDAPDGAVSEIADGLALIPDLVPAGTFGAVIVYERDAQIRAELGPIARFRDPVLGASIDYVGKIQRDLTAGIRRAIAMLRRSDARRKAIVIVGDGADTNLDHAATVLEAMRAECERAAIAVRAINYSVDLGDELLAIRHFTDDIDVVTSRGRIAAAIAAATEHVVIEVAASAPASGDGSTASSPRSTAWILLAVGVALLVVGIAAIASRSARADR